MALPADNERALTESFGVIADPHERLAAIVHACAGPGIAESARGPQDLVPGCVSRVWIIARNEAGGITLQWDADSPLVKGLAGLVCTVYNGSNPAEAAAHDTDILRALGLDRHLSPTRLHGLEQTARRIRTLAATVVEGGRGE